VEIQNSGVHQKSLKLFSPVQKSDTGDYILTRQNNDTVMSNMTFSQFQTITCIKSSLPVREWYVQYSRPCLESLCAHLSHLVGITFTVFLIFLIKQFPKS